jgi:hypothetical protein
VIRGGPRDLGIAAAVFGWITVVLVRDPWSTLGEQRAWGVATWAVLFWLLRRETALVRTQVAVVVAFATAVEYVFSPLLEVYVYRLDNVPAFVPPGHGLVYLCALALGRSVVVRRYRRALIALTLVAGGAYALWGLFGTDRVDALGAFWFGCLVAFLRWGRSTLLYVGAVAIVTYLELLGTWLGVWEWQPLDPIGLVPIGNPPSGAAGGYGWFDLAALTAAPGLLRLWQRFSDRPAGRGQVAEGVVVQQRVARHRAAAARPRPPAQIGEPSARLGHHDGDRREVVQRDLGLRGDVDSALGDEHVGPEVAVRAGPPAGPGQL